MDINQMIQSVKTDPSYNKMGMIACHLGVVRENSLSGKNVRAVEVSFSESNIQNIIHKIEMLEGIFKVLVETKSGRLKVGDEIMAVVVGGDTREYVFPALITAVDRIKKEGSSKKEIF